MDVQSLGLKSSVCVKDKSEIFGQGLKFSYSKNVNFGRKNLRGRSGVAFSVLISDVNKEALVSEFF